ncbi:PAS domain-containing sensor histidine kinase [Flavobacterium sp. ASW18X]|uniref:PAS domain-containing sensor histidine kinase n=1 Tax=Flavobacterium sp. ASW18X TaxID=2572595 RepID=UPI0010ADBC04|nr:PAS domain-containing sensor histidine kinase [Flavobacterium sp. ASW18X]TKD66557.1 PAS domain S-box protein [Flavobacterium sp. ASW18X]
MDNKEIQLLKRALDREKRSRKAAESLLEQKSKELYDASRHLREVNGKLEAMLTDNGAHWDGAFVNIIDPYIVIDLKGNVLNMNQSAKDFMGFDHEKDRINLASLVHKDYVQYTKESFKSLAHTGLIKNYNAKINTLAHGERFININASLIYNQEGLPVAAQGVVRDITREIEIKELLEDQRKQQDIIVENSSLGILLTVKDVIVKANKTFVDLLGYTAIELANTQLNDISSIEDLEEYQRIKNSDDSALQDKYSVVRKFKKKNGEYLYGKTSVNTVRNQAGAIDYQVVMIEDITQDRISEERLKTSEQRMSTLITNLQTGVLLEDVDRKVVLTNKKFCDLFHVTVNPEVLVGVDCKAYLERSKTIFQSPEEEINRINAILEKKELVVSDEIELADGRTLERDYIPLYVDNVYSGHLWTYNDVTIKKNYRRNLEAEKLKYGNIVANMNLGLVEVDTKGHILMTNNRFSEMVGVELQNLVGENVLNLIDMDADTRERIKQQFAKRQEHVSDSYEIEVRDKNGILRNWLVSAAPSYDESGHVVGSIGVHLDITEQKQLEKELEQSNKGLQEYAHIVSHDLKSPLRSVTALITWLQEDYKEVLDENGQHTLKMITDKIEGMDRLIGGILKYSTVNSDTLDNTNVDVNEVIKEITEIIYIPDHVSVQIVGKLPTIKADKTKIHQLFQNFLSNAVVNIDKEVGVVAVASKETPTHWEFSVKDNGVGIPKEYHEKIFKIFQSIGNNERSTGIGLSIVKKIIDRYDGKVWLDSEIGVGTTFYFTLKKM